MMKILGTFSLILLLSHCELGKALQCYVCENCIEGEELQELHICGEVPLNVESSTPTTVRPITLPASISSSQAANVVTTSSSGITNATIPVNNTSKADSEDYDDYYYNYSDEDEPSDYDSDEDTKYRQRRHGNHKLKKIAQPKMDDMICYMIKIKINETFTQTNRGCAAQLADGNDRTCSSLADGGVAIEDCQLCMENGCNKFLTDWNGPNFGISIASSHSFEFPMLLIILTIYRLIFIF